MRIAIIGDGSMATVCAQVLACKQSSASPPPPLDIRVWGRDAQRLALINASHENARYLPGIPLAPHITFDADDAGILKDAALILCAVPSQHIRAIFTRLKPHIAPGIPLVSVSKGIEIETLLRLSQILREILGPRPIAALSGPSIAGELARKLPATMVTASDESPLAAPLRTAAGEEFPSLAHWIQELFTTPYLRVYRNPDLLGVELAGALKNVIAIAAGILDGMRAGNNAKAALLSRGLVEISRLGIALGALPETFTGLAGLGDLVTTCVSPEGRNRSFGERIGRGEKPTDVLASMVGVVEGMPTCRSVVRLARDNNIDMPIAQSLHGVLYDGCELRSQLAGLMARELKSES